MIYNLSHLARNKPPAQGPAVHQLLNLNNYFLVFFGCSGLDYGTDCFCDPALLANDLAHIGRSYLKFDQCVVTL